MIGVSVVDAAEFHSSQPVTQQVLPARSAWEVGPRQGKLLDHQPGVPLDRRPRFLPQATGGIHVGRRPDDKEGLSTVDGWWETANDQLVCLPCHPPIHHYRSDHQHRRITEWSERRWGLPDARVGHELVDDPWSKSQLSRWAVRRRWPRW